MNNTRKLEILKSLESSDQKIAGKAIKDIKKEGNAEMLPSLFDIYQKTENETLKNDLESVFFQLKDEKALPFLIEAIKDEKYESIKKMLVSAIWESGLEADDHLLFLVETALKSDYLTCIEILTVIDSMENLTSDSVVSEAMSTINEQLQWQKTDNDALLGTMIVALQEKMVG